MKSLLCMVPMLWACAALAGTPGPSSGSSATPPDSSEVIVGRLEQPLPSPAGAAVDDASDHWDPISKFLWDTFANKPEEQKFSVYTTKNLESNKRSFAKALVDKARRQSLDAVSLDSCLVRVLKSGLPVGAYATTQGSTPVWIIVVKWEFGSETHPFQLQHIRVYAFDARTFAQVGFVTCG